MESRTPCSIQVLTVDNNRTTPRRYWGKRSLMTQAFLRPALPLSWCARSMRSKESSIKSFKKQRRLRHPNALLQLSLAPLQMKSPKLGTRSVDGMNEKLENIVKARWSWATSAKSIDVCCCSFKRAKAYWHRHLSHLGWAHGTTIDAVKQTGRSAVLAVVRRNWKWSVHALYSPWQGHKHRFHRDEEKLVANHPKNHPIEKAVNYLTYCLGTHWQSTTEQFPITLPKRRSAWPCNGNGTSSTPFSQCWLSIFCKILSLSATQTDGATTRP